jgi:anti-anti-sigma factor
VTYRRHVRHDGQELDELESGGSIFSTESRWEDDRLVVVVDGEVDLSTADSLYTIGTADGAEALTLDLRTVGFFDSAAIRTVIRLADRYPDAFTVLPSAHVRRVLEFCGLGGEAWLNPAA